MGKSGGKKVGGLLSFHFCDLGHVFLFVHDVTTAVHAAGGAHGVVLARYSALGTGYDARHSGQFEARKVFKGVVTPVGTGFGLLSFGYGVLGHGEKLEIRRQKSEQNRKRIGENRKIASEIDGRVSPIIDCGTP